MWKFRSMVTNADRLGGAITANRDQRVTRVGAFLRRTKLDEFPQFFNVLIGDMTLIGPRAEAPGIVAKYTERQRETLRFKPGITGVGAIHYTTEQMQTIPDGVSAEGYYIEHLLPHKLEMELAYESTRTLWRDVKLIQSTLSLILKRNH
jgi:lipopolysaccharide/colanic/teichoic acid biosynthesis glycosyltransferase